MRFARVGMSKVHDDAVIPTYAHDGDAGMDLHYCGETVTLQPLERKALETGLTMALPPMFAGFIHPRSGMTLDRGLTVANAPGTIDSGYRGEIKVILVNLSDEAQTVQKGDRIAQLVIQPVSMAQIMETDDIDSLPIPSARGPRGPQGRRPEPSTPRGAAGFGSTGV